MSVTNDKLIKNMISYFNETKITEQFKKEFLEILKHDDQFQLKLNQMVDEGEKPENEQLWKKILETEGDLLSQETKSKLFNKFEDILHEIFQRRET